MMASSHALSARRRTAMPTCAVLACALVVLCCAMRPALALKAATPVLGRDKGGASAMASNRRLLSPPAEPTPTPVPEQQLPSCGPLAGVWQQDARAGLPPTCPSGRYVVGHLVPLTQDCGSPHLSAHDAALDDFGVEYYDNDLNAYDVRLSVCSDAFGPHGAAYLGPIYEVGEEEAFTVALGPSRPSDGAMYFAGGQALELWQADGSVGQAFHFHCDVTAASYAGAAAVYSGPEAPEGRLVMVGDQCRIRHPDSGMCMVVDEMVSTFLPGHVSMVLDDCARPGSNDGAMWRFCAVRQDRHEAAEGQQAGGLRSPGLAAAH